MSKHYSVGIDLGTSNSVLSVAAHATAPEILPVTQVSAPNTLEEKALLPSAVYLPAGDEFSASSLSVPWNAEGNDAIIGAFARSHGALVPERLITSAKSWLCNSHVDRQAAILPWKSEAVEHKRSPVAVSAMLLEHLRNNFQLHCLNNGRFSSLAEAHVVVTVPASFDEAARSLTHEAAAAAGWGEVTLLEEPQAAFYSWISDNRDSWRNEIAHGDVVLVCDVGGGTADFSLIAVGEDAGKLQLHRISVGDHILLGGDNMDLALAYAVSSELEAAGTVLDGWQFLALTHLARTAKERLLSDDALEHFPLSIPGRGSSLFQSTITASLSRSALDAIVLEGFFPLSDISEMPHERRQVGLREYGLPYAADPALSKHLAKFLVRSLANVRSEETLSRLVPPHLCNTFLRPTAVLFNGGVFQSPRIRSRVLDMLRRWSEGAEVRELPGADLDLAVAKGAAYYGEVLREGGGLRIKAGTARSFYLGLESSGLAVPGRRPAIKGLCVVPQGTEEGTNLHMPEVEFGLVTGEEVTFRFFSSIARAGDAIGTIVEDAEKMLDESPPLALTLPADSGIPGSMLPVVLSSVVTELGTLELWLEHPASQRKWQLEFNLRAAG